MDLNDLDVLSLKSKAASAQPSKFKPRSKPRGLQKLAKEPTQDRPSRQSGTSSTPSGVLGGSTPSLPASATAQAKASGPAVAAAALPPATRASARASAGVGDVTSFYQTPASAASPSARTGPPDEPVLQAPAPAASGEISGAAPRSAASAGQDVGAAGPRSAAFGQIVKSVREPAVSKLAAPQRPAKAVGKTAVAADASQHAAQPPRKGRGPAAATAAKSTIRKSTAYKQAASKKLASEDSQPSDNSALTLVPPHTKPAQVRKQTAKGTAAQKKAAATRAQRAAKRATSFDKGAEQAGSPTEDSPQPPKGKGSAAKKRKTAVGEQPIDVETMSLKEVIKWSNSRERITINAEKAEHKRRAAALAQEREERGEDGEGEPSPAALPALPAPPPSAGTPSGIAPQVHIIDGQIVVNTDTLTVQAQEAGAPRTIVSGLSQTLNSNSYAINRSTSERWLPEETENFYNALATFGSDFQTISQLFPGKNRRVIKNKFSRESKQSPRRIDEALKGRSCNTSAYKNVLSRMLHDAESEEMLEIATEG